MQRQRMMRWPQHRARLTIPRITAHEIYCWKEVTTLSTFNIFSSCIAVYKNLICVLFFFSEPLMKSGIHRIPYIEHAEIRQMINGPESFTPDMHAIMGEAPEVFLWSQPEMEQLNTKVVCV